MARRSIRQNKNIFQLLREANGLSREKASELLGTIAYSRLIRIESGETAPYPDEIIIMADVYGEPNLPNIFCANECPLGQAYVSEVKVKDLSVVTLELLNLLNRLSKQKDRLIEITADGEITPDEYKDFKEIKKNLEQMSMAIDSMQLWIDNMIVDGKIDKNEFK